MIASVVNFFKGLLQAIPSITKAALVSALAILIQKFAEGVAIAAVGLVV